MTVVARTLSSLKLINISYLGIEALRVMKHEGKPELTREESINSMRNYLGSRNIYVKMFWWIWTAAWCFTGIGLGTWWKIIPLGWEIWSWAVPLIVCLCAPSIWALLSVIGDHREDLRVGQTELTGKVGGKKIKRGYIIDIPLDILTFLLLPAYCIQVNGELFSVTKKVFNWLQRGQQIRIHCWPNTRIVSQVDRLP